MERRKAREARNQVMTKQKQTHFTYFALQKYSEAFLQLLRCHSLRMDHHLAGVKMPQNTFAACFWLNGSVSASS